ncbi:MEDS domain-containing protein [Pseudonocardia acaciae]|uniref:MEDS domain-containing protein n=1 Tax=Pseudonocardia acaciae TaxID=551276 RepID=UPI0006886ADC|nr:MEDS domain-containing protein [Pseudonocardia acaciae]
MSKTLDEIALGDHACVVMDSDEQHWEVAAGFVRGGFARDEKVFYYDGARSAAPLLRRLREDNVDVAKHMRTGQLTMVPPEVTDQLWKMSLDEMTALVGRTIAESFDEGYSRIRITDEPVGAVHRPSGLALADYDRAVHDALQGHPVTLLCQYERIHWSIPELDELCEMHPIDVITPAIYDDGLLRITRQAPFSTRVAGEIDFSNRHLVRSVIDKELDRALRTADQTNEIQVHLESLRFADVTTIVQFVQAAEGFPQSHKLVLYGVKPGLRRVLDRCGAGFAEQLTLREASTA